MTVEFVLDKTVDFVLIFVGLYAAIAVQRWQDQAGERDEYVAMLHDFARELETNRDQEGAIVEDLGPILVDQQPPEIGDMRQTFDAFFGQLHADEAVLRCLHDEYAVEGRFAPEREAECHALYDRFVVDHGKDNTETSFDFEPVVLTPFYRYEVWQMYLANGVRIFANKELAVALGEIYNNAKIIERQVAEIEAVYNDEFMKQVGRTAATDLQLAELVHDVKIEQRLTPERKQVLIRVEEAIKNEHYAVKEIQLVIEMNVERMKSTVLLLRSEIEAASAGIEIELATLAQ